MSPTSHSAKEQTLGYVYQLQLALLLLLESDDGFLISIEKFDDIAFETDGTPVELVQAKHHVNKQANLTNYSVDLWKTIRVWIDTCNRRPDLLIRTRFTLITTASAPPDSVCYFLRQANSYGSQRDISKCYSELLEVAQTSENASLRECFDSFIAFGETKAKTLLGNIYVFDNSPRVDETGDRIRKRLRVACHPKHENAVYERVIGAWYSRCIVALCKEEPSLYSFEEIREDIVGISSEYHADNLPINIDDHRVKQAISGIAGNESFCKQLQLLRPAELLIKKAIEDYCKASAQRSNWINDGLLFPDELQKYENRLLDAWQIEFGSMQSKLGSAPNEKQMINAGLNLYTEMLRKSIFIREKCTEGFVMRGSYHILSNDLRVGWRADFSEKLCVEKPEGDDEI